MSFLQAHFMKVRKFNPIYRSLISPKLTRNKSDLSKNLICHLCFDFFLQNVCHEEAEFRNIGFDNETAPMTNQENYIQVSVQPVRFFQHNHTIERGIRNKGHPGTSQ